MELTEEVPGQMEQAPFSPLLPGLAPLWKTERPKAFLWLVTYGGERT